MSRHLNKLTIGSGIALAVVFTFGLIYNGPASADEETTGTTAGTVVTEPVLRDVCRTDDGGLTYTFVSGVPETELRDSDVYDGEDGYSVTGQADCTALNAPPEVEETPPPPPDSDGDGLPDDVDACPNEAPTTDADSDGCEDPPANQGPVDSDGDGVNDDTDQCPADAAVNDANGDGCEDPPIDNNDPPADSDGDGVTDDVDACPDAAPSVDEDGDGCEDEAAAAGDVGPAAVCPATAQSTVAGFGTPPEGCGEIRICKQFQFDLLDNTGQEASFTTGGNGLPASFSLVDDECEPAIGQPAFALTPGEYTITEDLANLPEFFKLFDVVCAGDENPDTDDDATATIDLVAGEDVICTFTNVEESSGLQICKIFDPATLGVHAEFESDIPSAPSFSLPNNLNQNCNPDLAFFDLLPGTYTITETITPAGFQLTDIDCFGFPFEEDLATGTIDVTLADNDFVTCTFTNTAVGGGCNPPAVAGFGPPPTTFCIEICKITLPPGVDQDFVFGDAFTLNASGNTNRPCHTLPAVDPDGPTLFFTENATPGWTLSDIICQGGGAFLYGVESGSFDSTFNPGDDTASVDLIDGDAQCIFTNTLAEDAGTIEVCKNFDRFVAGTPVDQLAEFTGDNGFTPTFTLGDDDVGELDCEGPISLTGGETYTIEEDLVALPEFFELGGPGLGILCEGDTNSVVTPNEAAGSVQIELAAGENVSCTFNNRQQFGGLQICKDFVGTLAGTEQAEFTSDVPGLTFFLLADNGCNPANSNTTQNVLPGTYNVTEDLDALPAGFVLTDIACETVGGTPVDFPAQIDLAAGSMDITLTEIDFVTCTFTNTQVGGGCTTPAVAGFGNGPVGCVEVCKATNPAGANQDFDFGGGVILNASAPGTQCHVFDPVTSGIELVENPIPQGWALTGINCQSTGGSTFVYLGASESPTDDFEPGDDTVQVTIADGDDVQCIFTNTQVIGGGCTADSAVAGFGEPTGCIEVCKVTNPPGVDQDFSFGTDFGPLNASDPGTQCHADQQLAAPLTYTRTEIVPAGWQLTDIDCQSTGIGGSTFQYGESGNFNNTFELGDDTALINLAEGDNVQCIFTNTQIGGGCEAIAGFGGNGGCIEICKVTVPPGADQTFDFGFTGGGITGPFDLNPSTEQCQVFTGLAFGNYRFTENPTVGWALTLIDCHTESTTTVFQYGVSGDESSFGIFFQLGDNTAEVRLGSGQTAQCIFTNTQVDCVTPTAAAGFGGPPPQECATIQVAKELDPFDANDRFDLLVNGVTVFDDAVDGSTSAPISADPDIGHTVGEIAGNADTDLGNYTTFIECINQEQQVVADIGNNTSLVIPEEEIEPGDAIVCTIVNVPEQVGGACTPGPIAGFGSPPPLCGFIQVCKNFGPPVGPEIEASFETDYLAVIGPDFVLSDEECFPEGTEGTPLPPGDYTITELVDLLPPGFEFDTVNGINCLITGQGGSTFLENGPSVTVTLESDDSVVCIFNNAEVDQSVTICKETVPSGIAFPFPFEVESQGASNFTLTGHGDCHLATTTDISAGQSAFTELVPDGWELTGIDCGDPPESIVDIELSREPQLILSVEPGEHIVCTFTNTRDVPPPPGGDDDDDADDDDQPGQDRQPRPREPEPGAGGKPGVGTGDGSFSTSDERENSVLIPALAFLGITGLLALGYGQWQASRRDQRR